MKCLLCKNKIKPFHVFQKKALFNKPTALRNMSGTLPMALGYCGSCRHISSDVSASPKWPKAQEKIYKELYSSFTPGELSKTQKAYTKFLFKWLNAAVPRGKILEIGSHDGYFLSTFKEAGWVCKGVEPSPSALIAEKKYGVPTLHDFFTSKQFGQEKFDLIVAKHVVEHVSNPLEFTRQAASLLRNNGYLYIEVPNSYISLHDTYFPEFHVDHISYFTVPSLEKLVSMVGGLEIVGLESTWAHMKFPFLHILLKKTAAKERAKKDSRGPTYLLDNSISHIIRKFKSYYPVYLANLRNIQKKYKKIALWGAGSCGTQFAIDGQFKKTQILVVDPNKSNQGKYLTVTGHLVHSPYVLRKNKIDTVLAASGWEDDVIRQIPHYAGRKIKIIKFFDLLK